MKAQWTVASGHRGQAGHAAALVVELVISREPVHVRRLSVTAMTNSGRLVIHSPVMVSQSAPQCVCLSVCLCVLLSVCLFVCLSVLGPKIRKQDMKQLKYSLLYRSLFSDYKPRHIRALCGGKQM